MSRALSLALLILPTLLVGGWVGGIVAERERLPVHRIALVGVDPRDLLRGHYLVARLDLVAPTPAPDAEIVEPDQEAEAAVPDPAEPSPEETAASDTSEETGDDPDVVAEITPFPDYSPCACLDDNPADPLRPIARPLESCTAEALRQCPRPMLEPGQIFQLYVPQEQAPALERMIRDRSAPVTVGVRFTGTGAILLGDVRPEPRPQGEGK